MVETLRTPEIQNIEKKREGSGGGLPPWELMAGVGAGAGLSVLIVVFVVAGIRKESSKQLL